MVVNYMSLLDTKRNIKPRMEVKYICGCIAKVQPNVWIIIHLCKSHLAIHNAHCSKGKYKVEIGG